MHGKRHEISLGRYPDMSLADANSDIAILKSKLKKNIDPLAERQRADNTIFKTVDDLAEDWLKDCERRLKHHHIPRRVYTKDLAPTMGRLGLDQVTPRDIRATINKNTESGRPTIANDALMYCKQLFRHGIKLDLLTSNPADPFTVSDAGGVEKSRSRALSYDEVKAMFKAFHKYSDQFTRENTLAAALLITLGVRKGELIAARWEEFDTAEKLWHIPEERSKTEVAICIPLPEEVLEWLQELFIRANGSEFVFPNRRASKRFGHISPDTLNAAIKRCLNHKLKGVEGIYDRYDYLDERREAIQLIANKLSPVITQSARVLNFNRRKAVS